MKLELLIQSAIALSELVKKSLPINISWELKKFIRIAGPEIKTFEELKDQKIREMGEEVLTEDGNPTGQVKVKAEFMQEYIKIMSELAEKEIEVKIPEIKISELLEYRDVNGRKVEISTEDLMILDWLIVE